MIILSKKSHLGQLNFHLFSPTQLRFVAVHWTVGFPRLQETNGCLVSEGRTNSFPQLCASSDQHSVTMEEEQKEAERSETGSERDKVRMPMETG